MPTHILIALLQSSTSSSTSKAQILTELTMWHAQMMTVYLP